MSSFLQCALTLFVLFQTLQYGPKSSIATGYEPLNQLCNCARLCNDMLKPVTIPQLIPAPFGISKAKALNTLQRRLVKSYVVYNYS